MSQQNENQAISRRRFLTVLGATSLASGIAGAGFTVRQMGKNSVSVSPSPTYQPAQFDESLDTAPQIVVENPAELAQAQERLAQVSREKMQLQAEVDSLKQQLESTEKVLGEKLVQIVDLEIELEETTKSRSAALGLVALYEQLEDVDIGATFQTGLKAVGDAWDDFIGDLPAASDGLVQASARISEFDRQIPLFQSARTWLSIRLELLRRDSNVLQEVLKGFADPIGPLLEMLGSWFDDVRKWVPSRFLETANSVIDSLMAMISGVPVTVEGAETNLSNVLEGWFGDDDEGEIEKTPIIRSRLFQPLTSQVLPQALTMLQKTRIAKQKYEADLVTQVVETLNRRRSVESQIMAYRGRNNLNRVEI